MTDFKAGTKVDVAFTAIFQSDTYGGDCIVTTPMGNKLYVDPKHITKHVPVAKTGEVWSTAEGYTGFITEGAGGLVIKYSDGSSDFVADKILSDRLYPSA